MPLYKNVIPSLTLIEPTSCAVKDILLAECSVSVDSTTLVNVAELLGIAAVKFVVPFTATTCKTFPPNQPVVAPAVAPEV